MVAASLYNVQRTKRSDPMLSWLDFFPDHRPVREPQTEEQMLGAMDLWARKRPNP